MQESTKFLDKIPTMDPSLRLSIFIETILILVMIVCVYYISIFLFFNNILETTEAIVIVTNVSLLTFILDILKTFTTGIYIKGLLVMDKAQIS